jgi:hypothetical protein
MNNYDTNEDDDNNNKINSETIIIIIIECSQKIRTIDCVLIK